VRIAPLEGRFWQDLADRHAKVGAIVGDDELDAVEAPPTQAEEEVLPGCAGSRGWPNSSMENPASNRIPRYLYNR
jgi:hypothetical protein